MINLQSVKTSVQEAMLGTVSIELRGESWTIGVIVLGYDGSKQERIARWVCVSV
jgi:hypothetical protein